MLTLEEAEFYKARALEFCDFIVDGTDGRLREDPVIQAVTEGHGGSSCGFLPHFLAYALGVRERWVNRAAPGAGGYRDGENLSLLFGATWGGAGPKCARRVTSGQLFKAADVLIIEDPAKPNDDHVLVCAKDFDGDVLYSYDMGQRGAPPERPGLSPHRDARFCERAMRLEPNGRWETRPEVAAGAQIWASISLPELIAEARANGRLVEPLDPCAWWSSLKVIHGGRS